MFEKAYTDDETIAMLEESTPEESSKLVSTYKAGNVDEMYDFTTDKKYTSEKTKRLFLTKEIRIGLKLCLN